jgi:hypothetical protein
LLTLPHNVRAGGYFQYRDRHFYLAILVDFILLTLYNMNMKKTREDIITSMCYTWRHDYGLVKEWPSGTGYNEIIEAGMTQQERDFLYKQMAQIFDNDIAPYMEFKQ